jgi:hypothetical protein
VRIGKANASEPPMKCRKRRDDVKTGEESLPRDQRWSDPLTASVASGIKVARVRSRLEHGTWEPVASMPREKPKWKPHEGQSTDAGHRGGWARSSAEVPVMGMERRGPIIQFRRGVNQAIGRNPAGRRGRWPGDKSRMSREAPVRFREGLGVKLPRATRLIIHAKSRAQSEHVLEAVRQRLKECRLDLHPEKTKIVYCQDDDRKDQHEHIKFDFLGYTFRPRRAKNRRGKFFVSFLPAISDKAAKAIRETIRDWRLAATRNNQSLEEIAGLVNPSVRGWANYYGRFYRSALTPVLRHLERALVRWAQRKYKRLRRHSTHAVYWLGRVARRDPKLFVLWQLGIRPATGS